MTEVIQVAPGVFFAATVLLRREARSPLQPLVATGPFRSDKPATAAVHPRADKSLPNAQDHSSQINLI